MTLHTARRRWRALSCAAFAAAIIAVGCRDDLTSPIAGTTKREAPQTARSMLDPGSGESPQSVTIALGSPDIYDGSVTVSSPSFGFYTYPTTVKVTISGGVETYTPNFDGIGPAQGPFTAPGRLFLGWTDGPFFASRRIDASGMYLSFFGQSNVFVASRSALGVLTLDGFRPPGSNQFIFCGPSHGVPCFQVGGDAGTLTLERVETSLAVTAESQDVAVGATPYFDFRSSPQFAPDGQQLQWVVASSSWVPDSVTADDPIAQGDGIAACQPEYFPACRRLMKSSGTFTLSAYVNGKFDTKSVHVHVRNPHVKLTADKDSVALGETVILTATPVDGTSLDVSGYTFQAEGQTANGNKSPTVRAPATAQRSPKRGASANSVPSLPECTTATVAQCYITPTSTGRWTVNASVDGTPSTDNVRVAVSVPTLKLTASPDSIGAGETTTLTATAPGSTEFVVHGYDFQPDQVVIASTGPRIGAQGIRSSAGPRANDAAQQGTPCNQQQTAKVCQAQPDNTGTWTVRATVNGREMTASTQVKVGGVAIKVVKAEGPNAGGSFTTKSGEDKIVLQAQVTPSSLSNVVQWEVVDAPDDLSESLAPTSVAVGANSFFLVPFQSSGRWPSDHALSLDLNRKKLRYKIRAFVTHLGKTTYSDPVFATADLEDTARLEYMTMGVDDEGHHLPAHNAFFAHDITPANGAGENAGDYTEMVKEPRFAAKLDTLKGKWTGTWQINVIYRSPVHNLVHVSASNNPSSLSWHMWGCAADLQTFPSDRSPPGALQKAEAFHKKLSELAHDLGWDVEPRTASGVGHVHVERDCP